MNEPGINSRSNRLVRLRGQGRRTLYLFAKADEYFRAGIHSRLSIAIFAALSFVFFLSGCVNPIPPNTLAKEVAKKKEPAPIPARIDGKGWHITWKSRNLAKADAKALPVLVADAETGEFTSDTDPPAMGLNTVQAQVFQEGSHIANIVAARIDADRDEETIYGSGGVTIHSLKNPPDTIITADAMQWDKNTSRLIATGSAKLTRPARGKQPAFSQSGNRIVYDMKQGNFDVQ